MTTAQLCICIAIVVYLLAMLGIGIWCAKKNSSVDDFYLGGRKLGPFVTATAMEITTQLVATRRESLSFFSSSMAMNRSRMWGMPK